MVKDIRGIIEISFALGEGTSPIILRVLSGISFSLQVEEVGL